MNDILLQIGTTIRAEFQDLQNVSEYTRIVIRLSMAVLLGGLLGYERESHGKSAGLRTHMLVALGAAMFVLVPLQAGMSINDSSRVLQGIIAGIGFLGAGAIMKSRGDGRIHGLTTAASIWLTASVGIAAGMGRESTAVITTLFALFILSVLKRFSRELEPDVERAERERAAANERQRSGKDPMADENNGVGPGQDASN
ncbi:MgtC/SapB family protein [Achromobacter sp. GG226]|uniref:MgtC/SapB family protein n=1 Tax=Verticiella alkaliphila TaxID=2779529 RepID=UPI001C0D6473|nr:MgtC/SapB family protein [Verticiella sp. GG226]MBU4612057.1 MgtC/SapB family protein [Verticiella sp. GG226]